MAVARGNQRPLAIPEIFNGEGKQLFSDWVDHFESVAAVNDWGADDRKKWIRARLTARAATAYKRLTAEETADYDAIVAALKRRFEPQCRKEVYMAEFQRRKKLRSEDWASYGEDLRTLVEKAYPTLQAEAQELLALNRFLSEITDVQLAFGVRQRAPATLDAAVAATLELETYLHKSSLPVESVNTQLTGSSVAGVSKSDGIEDVLKKLLERIDRLEGALEAQEDSKPSGGHQWVPHGDRRSRHQKLVCWDCREEGHFARDCPKKATKKQGNEKPSGQ